MKIRKMSQAELSELHKRSKRDRSGLLSHLILCYETVFAHACDPNSEDLEFKSFDMILHCPECGKQHIDGAEPDKCELCGELKSDHPEFIDGGHQLKCIGFKAWLNPPHKSHRCHFCNTVWRPANIPTNGVKELQ